MSMKNDWPGPPRVPGVGELLHTPKEGKWCRMIHALTFYFKADEAWLLCYLANMERTAAKNLPRRYRVAGWFYCTIQKVRNDLGWGEDKQKYLLRKLRGGGFIETRQKLRVAQDGCRRGHYPVRWVRLNHAAITAKVNDAVERAYFPDADWWDFEDDEG